MSTQQLEALFGEAPATPTFHEEETIHLSAAELRQMAYDRAQDEVRDLEDERRRLLERHREELRPLEARIALNKRLMRDMLEQADNA